MIYFSMATVFRLNALTIFLILLATLLVGYLINHTWESFKCGCKMRNDTEGFGTLGNGYGTIVNGYSKDGKEIVDLYTGSQVYFDPVAKNFVEPISSSELKITNRNNALATDSNTHKYTTDTSKLVSLGSGPFNTSAFFDNNLGISGEIPGVTYPSTLDTVKTKIESISDTISTHLFELDMSGNADVSGGVSYTFSGELLTTQSYLANTLLEPISMASSSTDQTKQRFARVLDAENYVVKDPPSSSTNFAYIGNVTQGQTPKYAFLHIPVKGNGDMLTPVTFIHVMDLRSSSTIKPKHVRTYYFKGSDIEEKPITENILATGHSDINTVKGSDKLDFSTKFDDDMKALADGDFSVDVRHLTGDDAIKVVARKKETVGYSSFRALITFSASKPVLSKVETSAGEIGDSYNTENKDDKSDYTNKIKQYQELQASLFGFGNMRTPFYDYEGSPYTDFMLKTEVVPPVCPACPSCTNKGVCTNCGGNGGSGTRSKDGKDNSAAGLARDLGSGVDDFIRDGADGATNLARDATSGAVKTGENIVSGAVKTGENVVSGAVNTAGNAASGVGQFAKDAVGGVYGAASDVTKGTVGIGREIVGGAYNAVGNVAGAIAQGIPNYGSPSPGYGGQPPGYGPNSQMGGHNNSYGGGYMNQSQPQTSGQDPYSYFGAVPPKSGGCNYMPRTANFSSFGK
jgi:hypothetical protein